MQPKKIEPNDLFVIFEKLSNHLKDNINPETLNEDIVSLLTYNQILSFSKEELESATKNNQPRFADYTLFDEVIYHLKNPMLLMGLLSTSAFKSKLSYHSKWVLKNSKTPDLYTYSIIASIEKFYRTEDYEYDNEKISNKDYLLTKITRITLLNQDNNNLLESYLNSFKKFNYKIILDEIFDNSLNSKNQGVEHVLKLLSNHNVNINEFAHLNSYLPNNTDRGFFMSFSYNAPIEKFLALGFRFDESYLFNNKTLFHNLIISQREDLISTIITSLNNIIPKDENLKIEIENDIKALEQSKKITNKTFELISKIYQKTKLEHELPQKTEARQLLKI